MYLNKNVKLIILTLQCLMIYAASVKGENNCFLSIPHKNNLKSPVPSLANSKLHPTSRPNRGFLNVKHNSLFKLTCGTGKIISRSVAKINSKEIFVKCVKGHYVEYYGRTYLYKDLTCVDSPTWNLNVYRKKQSRINGKANSQTGFNGCSIPIPDGNDRQSPIPYLTSSSLHSNTTPQNGYLNIKQNSFFRLACKNGNIIPRSSDENINAKDILVRCLKGNSIKFQEKEYEVKDLLCDFENNKLSALYKRKKKLRNHHCTITIPRDGSYMPLPIFVSRLTGDIRIVYPNETGHIVINDGTHSKLTCAGSEFVAPFFFKGDIEIQCKNGKLMNRGNHHEFSSYKCKENPKPRMTLTQNICQMATNRILEVGVQTHYGFKVMYKICFDLYTRIPEYSWHFIRTPINSFRQRSSSKRDYNNIYFNGHIDVMKVYHNQSNRFEKLLRSKEVADKYINENKTTKDYLAPVRLIPEEDFLYDSEQHSTFFFENTAPQWLSFSEGIWREFEKLFLNNLNSSISNTHLVITGTYLPTMLPDKYGKQRAIYLYEPRMIPVPQYLWKMDYNIENEKGIVYIAMTNPYFKLNDTGYMCDTIPCPNFEQLSTEAREAIYCCTKQSFEKIYKVFDPAVYDRFY